MDKCPYRRNKRNLPVTFKPCPKCKGTGKVPCDGKDHIRQEYLYWAWSHHMKPVVYKGKNQSVAGIGVAGINPGGWAFLEIYISLSNEKMSLLSHRFNEEIGEWVHLRRRRKRGTKAEYQNFRIIECRGPDRAKVALLDIWPQELMLLPGTFELESPEWLALAKAGTQ